MGQSIVVIRLVYDGKPNTTTVEWWRRHVNEPLQSGTYDYEVGEYDPAIVVDLKVNVEEEVS